MTPRRAGYAAVSVWLWALNAVEQRHRATSRRYAAAHPPPPGQRQGSSWVAKRSQDIDE